MRKYLPRRTFLRGALATGGAATVGLPMLDAMLNLEGNALANGDRCPDRFVLWFWGNGTEPNAWAPEATGEGYATTELIRGIDAVKDYVHLVSGTELPTRKNNNPHVEGVVGILAGGNPVVDPSYASQNNDWDYMTFSGPSVDELAADLVGPADFRSLTLAVTPLHGVNGPGTAVRYTSHRGPYLFNPPVFEPQQVFDLLFAGGVPADTGPSEEDLARASVLDAVLEDARSLDARLGSADRERLEHHLDAVRELETRLRDMSSGNTGATCELPPMPSAADSYRQRAQAMSDLVAMAFACDLTRVVSMEFSSPASHAHYPDIFPARLLYNNEPTSFHEYEHNVGFDGSVRAGLQYFVDVFGDFLATLQRTPEAEGHLLDHSLVLGTSELSNGWRHRFDDFPLLIAGRANGAIAGPGRHVRLSGDNACRGPLTCLRALGSTDSFGQEQFQTSDPIAELLA
ncbi:MAG: DUF1552 domain-containing protein [Myxococcota bacterium]